MEETIQQKDREMTELTRVLQRENERGALMESQIRAQEVEIRTLLNCVENLRKQLISTEKVDIDAKYKKHDDLIEIYQDTADTIEKIKRERTVEVQQDVFDLAMKKIARQAEMNMIEIELKQIYEKFGGEIDLKSIGLDFDLVQ